MTSSIAQADPHATSIEVTHNELLVELADGRKLSIPLTWFPRLLNASPEARSHWELLGDGEGIHWPEADEDISVEGLLAGRAAIS